MSEIVKIWKKCTALRTLTDYSTDPPTVKEWVESVSTYDEDEDVMEENEFDEEGRIIRTRISSDNEWHLIEYDKNGLVIRNEITERVENEHGDEEEITEDDLGIRSAEKLEYDEKGRCIKKIFLENGTVNSWLEFEYDDRDRVVKTKDFENGKLEFYEEDIYVSEGESISLRYNSLGQITLRTEYKKLKDRNTYINSYYNDEGNLTARNEEDRDKDDEVLEQRFYDGKENLIRQIVFGANDEFGYIKKIVEKKLLSGELIEEIALNFSYLY